MEEGTKIHNDLHHKVEITNKARYGKLIYIITAFQTIFLPLQTITAIYGMNFDVFPVRDRSGFQPRSSTSNTATTSFGCFRRCWPSFSATFFCDPVFEATNSPQNLPQQRGSQHAQTSHRQHPASPLRSPLLRHIPRLDRHVNRLSAGKHRLPPLRLVRQLRLTPRGGAHNQRVADGALREEGGRGNGDVDRAVLARGSEMDGDGEVHCERRRAAVERTARAYSGWIVDSAMNTTICGAASSNGASVSTKSV